MLEVKPIENKKGRSFTLRPTTITIIEDLAKAYDSNASAIMEALIVEYGPKLLEQKTKRRKTVA